MRIGFSELNQNSKKLWDEIKTAVGAGSMLDEDRTYEHKSEVRNQEQQTHVEIKALCGDTATYY